MDRNSMTVGGCYVIGEKLGKGSHGTVWKAVHNVTGEVFAIKIMNENLSYQDCRPLAEARCLVKMRPHPNILSLHDVFTEGDTLYLVIEFMECDLFELTNRRGPFSENEVRNFCDQILKGLLHMHNEGYCHRDLKSENVLVEGDTIKIADFGLATNQLNQPLQPYVVTRPYRAPELLLGSTHHDFAIDIWAMGVIMVELFTGTLLFTGSNAVEQMDDICSVMGSPDSKTWLQGLKLAACMEYNFPEEFKKVDSAKQLSSLIPSASPMAIDLIKCFLSWDPKRRPTTTEALQHPFFHPSHNISGRRLLPPHSFRPKKKLSFQLSFRPKKKLSFQLCGVYIIRFAILANLILSKAE